MPTYVPKLLKIMLVLVIWFVYALIFNWIELNWKIEYLLEQLCEYQRIDL